LSKTRILPIDPALKETVAVETSCFDFEFCIGMDSSSNECVFETASLLSVPSDEYGRADAFVSSLAIPHAIDLALVVTFDVISRVINFVFKGPWFISSFAQPSGSDESELFFVGHFAFEATSLFFLCVFWQDEHGHAYALIILLTSDDTV